MAENLMLMCGAKITSNADKLMKVTADYVADKLRNPNPDFEAKIRQLRDMRVIDEKMYRECKKQLPYLVCGWFNQQVRRTENFAYIESFIVDLDHLKDKDIGVLSLKNLVCRDSRVMLCFVSPSEDGLKILFRLKEKCYDAGVFKVFYKEFVKSFAAQYNLTQVLDAVTCDVTRACFMSVDRDAYYNPDAGRVELRAFLDYDNPQEMFDTMHEQKKEEMKAAAKQKQEDVPRDKEPDDEALRKIKDLIGSKRQKIQKSKPPANVPERVSMIIPGLTEYIANNGAEVYEVIDIQDAKKLKIKLGLKLAEVNVFCGKRGYKIVVTKRAGTDPELNDTIKELIELYIAEH